MAIVLNSTVGQAEQISVGTTVNQSVLTDLGRRFQFPPEKNGVLIQGPELVYEFTSNDELKLGPMQISNNSLKTDLSGFSAEIGLKLLSFVYS